MTVVCPLPDGAVLDGFRASLDAQRMRGLLERHLLEEGTIVGARPVHARYKGLDGATVGWSVSTVVEDRAAEVYVTARSATTWRLRNEAERLGRSRVDVQAGLRPIALVEEEPLLLLTFPLDRMLRDLERVTRASKVRNLLDERPEWVGEDLRVSKRRSGYVLVRYKPERSATLRWSLVVVDGASRVVKTLGAYVSVHAEPVGNTVATCLRRLAHAGIRCPRPLAVPHARLVVRSEISGRPVDATDQDDLEAAGRILARLHDTPAPTGLPQRTAVHELDDVLRACRELRRLSESLGGVADEVADRLARWLPPAGDACFVHGDLHEGKVIVDGQEPGFVGFERSAAGPAARDLATFYAHAVESHGPGVDVSALEHGYASAGRSVAQRELLWFRACAVLRRASAPFRRLRPDWRGRGAELLEHAAELAREAAT